MSAEGRPNPTLVLNVCMRFLGVVVVSLYGLYGLGILYREKITRLFPGARWSLSVRLLTVVSAS